METRDINHESSSKKKKKKKKAKSSVNINDGNSLPQCHEPPVNSVFEKECTIQQNCQSINSQQQSSEDSYVHKSDSKSVLDFLGAQQPSFKECSNEGPLSLEQEDGANSLAQTASKKKKKKKKKKGSSEVTSSSTDTTTICTNNGTPVFLCNPEITITPINPAKKKKKKKKKNKASGDTVNSTSENKEISISTTDLLVNGTVSTLNQVSSGNNTVSNEQEPLECVFPPLESTKKAKDSRDVILVLDGVVVFPQLQSEASTEPLRAGVSICKSGPICSQNEPVEKPSISCEAKTDVTFLNTTKLTKSGSVDLNSESDQQLTEISSDSENLKIIKENNTSKTCSCVEIDSKNTINSELVDVLSETSDKMPESLNVSEGQVDGQRQNSTDCVLSCTKSEQQKTKAQLKAERRAAFEAQRAAQLAEKKPQGDTVQNDTQTKSKAQLRAERRALQEAQRAAKSSYKSETTQSEKVTDSSHQASEHAERKNTTSTVTKSSQDMPQALGSGDVLKKKGVRKIHADQEDQKVQSVQKFRPFSHLPQNWWDPLLTKDLGMAGTVIHPAVIRVGLQIAQGIICGSSARCVAMLSAFKEVINDYVTPSHKELSRDLESMIQPYISFLSRCRPLSVSMDNAVKFLKFQITHISLDMKDFEARKKLCNEIDVFIKNEIFLAREQIISFAGQKINDGDVVLTYACSSLVKKVLCAAHENNKKFRVIVVDARPKLEGREMLRCLIKSGIHCSYVLINSVSYIMKEVSKVILGAHSLQANGYVMSRVGSSQIALVARAYNVPVLVCCETYKFCERVHTDSFVYNELGNPDDLVKTTNTEKGILSSWREIPPLRLLNVAYDVTPPELVSMVIYEKGMLPCTSVPVVLRVKQAVT